jgi:hypothetical protein
VIALLEEAEAAAVEDNLSANADVGLVGAVEALAGVSCNVAYNSVACAVPVMSTLALNASSKRCTEFILFPLYETSLGNMHIKL